MSGAFTAFDEGSLITARLSGEWVVAGHGGIKWLSVGFRKSRATLSANLTKIA
jgi:hypothetical protein